MVMPRSLAVVMGVLMLTFSTQAEDTLRSRSALPPSLAQFRTKTAVALRRSAPGGHTVMPRSLYSLKAMEKEWERYRSDPKLRRELLPLTNRAEGYLAIPRTQWLAMLPDRSPAPICDFPNPGSSSYFHACPVTGAKLPQIFEPFDIIAAPFSVTLKSNGMVIYERSEDRPANSPIPVKGTISVPHWDNHNRTLEYCESLTVKSGKSAMRYYPANLVWRARLGAIIGTWSGGVLPDLAKAYRATGDNRFAELTLFILERLGKIIPNMPLTYYNGIDPQSRADLMKAAVNHTPVGWHGWLGPARINGGAENFRPPMEGYYVFNLSKAYLSIEDAPAWGQTPEAGKARKNALKNTLFKELSLLFSSYGAKNCVGNGIGMYAPGLVGLGLVLQDRYFFDGFNSILEEFLYNENFYDGICTEGSLNYAGMVGGMYSLWHDLRSLYEPDYRVNHPFITACGRSKQRLASLRGIESQHGDGPNMAFMAKGIKQGADGKELRQPSESFSGFGITMLRAGAAGKRLEVFLHHDRVTGHSHPDMLGLQVHFQGIPLISFIGDARMGRFIELQDDRNSSAKTLRALPYPLPMESTEDLQAQSTLLSEKAGNPGSAWSYGLNSSPFTKNTVVVDEYNDTEGRAPWRGGLGDAKKPFGNLRLFKGSPDPDSESAILQVAEATGENMLSLHYQGMRTYRRSVIAITRADGSPYLVDLFAITGGNRHMLLWHSFGKETTSTLAPKGESYPTMEAWLNTAFPKRREWLNTRNTITTEHMLTNVTVSKSLPPVWKHSWELDYATWAPKTNNPKSEETLLTPADRHAQGLRPVGLNLFGLKGDDNNKKCGITAKSVHPAIITEYVGEKRFWGMVRFKDGLSYAGTMNHSEQRTRSTFTHVLEPFAVETGATIQGMTRLKAASGGPLPEGVAGLDITFIDGSHDIVLALPPTLKRFDFDQGISMSGRFSLIRLDKDGRVKTTRLVSGNTLTYKGKELITNTLANFKGRVLTLEGDISGDRRSSALLIRPDGDWGELTPLKGRTVRVTFNRGRRIENYQIDHIEKADDACLRLILKNGVPFVDVWGRVQNMGPGKEARDPLNANEFIGQAFYKGGAFATPYLDGSKIAFPELGLSFTLKKGEERIMRFDIAEDVDLTAAGVKKETLYAIYPDAENSTVCIVGEAGL